MRPDERLALARLAYVRAVVLARASSTPASWRRLLTAAKNLEAAMPERRRERLATQGKSPLGQMGRAPTAPGGRHQH